MQAKKKRSNGTRINGFWGTSVEYDVCHTTNSRRVQQCSKTNVSLKIGVEWAGHNYLLMADCVIAIPPYIVLSLDGPRCRTSCHTACSGTARRLISTTRLVL